MLTLNEKRIEYKFSNCQQCGVCEAVCPKGAISMEFQPDGLHKVSVDYGRCIACGKCVDCCPADRRMTDGGYIERLKEQMYFMAYHRDNEIRRQSSSGGACRAIIIESLRQGLVDGVYSMRKLDDYPSAEGEFYTKENIPEYGDLPNSVYHAVLMGRNLKKVTKVDRLMIVGTACQLAALEKALKGKYRELVKICIFCKQQKTLDSTRYIAKMMGTEVPKNLKFRPRYRGEGWPGIVRVREAQLPWNRAAGLPFGRRLWTVPGCDVCGDPFGMEAGSDMSLMDPWGIRQPNDLGETVIRVATARGVFILESIRNLCLEEKSYAEIEPTLGLDDVARKRVTVPFFLGEDCSKMAQRAGKAEVRQRRIMKFIANLLPKGLHYAFYYPLPKFFPDFRNRIIKL